MSDMKHYQEAYRRQMEALNAILAEGLCDAFRQITGNTPSDRMRDTIYDLCERR